MTPRAKQEALDTGPVPRGPRRWCRDCRRSLTDPESVRRGWGPECDPERRTGRHDNHAPDQDPIPGT
ncbi:DUF6011 domain-containing protein [Streptomyces zhihengii]